MSTAAESATAYTASKASLNGLTVALAHEFAPDGIRVNAVAPSDVDTGMNLNIPDVPNPLVARTALKRMAHPAEIASAIVFLASKKASFVTGTILNVDGGFLTR